jgi:quercetin dioxygenase-like cupin family protein
MTSGAGSPQVLLAEGEGHSVQMGGLGVRFMIDAARSGGGFALVEHPIAPKALAAPLHRHRNEDEYTYVLQGVVGVQVGDEMTVAFPGDLVFKPRGIWHAFWNPSDAPTRALEIISPAGFERYFEEVAPLLPPTHQGPPDVEALGAVRAKYELEMDMDSIPQLIERHGLAPQGPPPE